MTMILWIAAGVVAYGAIGWALAWLLTEEPERYQHRRYAAMQWPLLFWRLGKFWWSTRGL